MHLVYKSINQRAKVILILAMLRRILTLKQNVGIYKNGGWLLNLLSEAAKLEGFSVHRHPQLQTQSRN